GGNSLMAGTPREGTAGPNFYRKFYGKYRGKVVDNVDLEGLGRICAEVPAVPGSLINWALPCVPYAGLQVGFYAIPPIDANVWIEFEGGDPNYPIWSGCFWGPEETPAKSLEEPPNPMTKVFATEFIKMVLDDVPEVGGFTLTVNPECVATPLSMTFNSEGIEINASPAIITMVTEEGITLTYPPSTIAMTAEAIEVDIADTSLTLTEENTALETPEASVTTEEAIQLSAGGAMTITAGEATSLVAGADMALAAGAAIEVNAGLDLSL